MVEYCLIMMIQATSFIYGFTGYPPVITQLNNVGLVGYATAVEGLSVFRVDGNSGSSVPEIGGLRNYDAHTLPAAYRKGWNKIPF